MRVEEHSNQQIRYNPNYKIGLNNEEINERKENHLDNKTPLVVGKSNWEIIKTDVLSFFNIVLFVLAGLMIFGNVCDTNRSTKWYSGLFFVLIILSNIVLSLYQDIKAKFLMKKMKLLTMQNAKVIREEKEILINPQDIVLDDILLLKNNDQIPADSIIVEGEVYVNESLLTGESINIIKKKGDLLLSGTYITGGSCYAKVEKVGKDNYIETISAKAKAFKRNPSDILKSLKKLFRVLGTFIFVFFIIIVITYAIQGHLSSVDGFINVISPLTGQFVAMVPAGLYLLTSITLATGVVALYRKKANVQDFYSIEMLARTNILCVDKTGTITDGKMVVTEIKPLEQNSREEIKNIIGNIIASNDENNVTAEALNECCKIVSNLDIVSKLNFNSENKYSAISLENGKSYVLGAAEFMDLDDEKNVSKTINEYTKSGYRVLTLAVGDGEIKNKKFIGKTHAISLIILRDHIKESAKETFKWFKENNVEIKVISGDNALTVSNIASEAGIENAHKYISLEGMNIDEVKAIANDYVVFGRVTPEQKEAIVLSLKQNGNTVAMTGDGANDMLALKRADCSIAMNSGAQAAKNVSHIVLLNNDFSTMPEIVGEGRRVINNIERTGSLFLTKTFFAIVLAITFWIISICTANQYAYPFAPSNLMVWEIFGFGLSAFFISLEKNSKPIRNGFLRNILVEAIPQALILILGVAACYICFVLQKNGLVFTSVGDFGFNTLNTRAPRTGATAISVLVFTTLSLFILLNTCKPLNKYRSIVVIGATLASALCFGIGSILPDNIFLIDFASLTIPNLIVWLAIVIVLGSLTFYVKPVSKYVLEKMDNKNKK